MKNKPAKISTSNKVPPYPNNLRKLRKERGLTQADIAKVWGVERGDVSQRESGEVSITQPRLKMLTKAYGWTASQILNDEDDSEFKKVSVLGYVGAGAEVFCQDDHAKGAALEKVDAPIGYLPEGIVAVRVRGESMEPQMEDGWLIFYKKDFDGVPPDCIGELCVVKLENDGMLVKKIRNGSKPGYYHLLSKNPNHEPIVDARLQWASRVIDIRPK